MHRRHGNWIQPPAPIAGPDLSTGKRKELLCQTRIKVQVTWDYKAEQAAKLLRKGARVHVIGRIELDSWNDKETGEPREKIRLLADDVLLSLTRVKSVEFEARRNEEDRTVG